MTIQIGDLVEWDATPSPTMHMGTVAAFRPSYGCTLALIDTLDSPFIASVGVQHLRLVKEVTA